MIRSAADGVQQTLYKYCERDALTHCAAFESLRYAWSTATSTLAGRCHGRLDEDP